MAASIENGEYQHKLFYNPLDRKTYRARLSKKLKEDFKKEGKSWLSEIFTNSRIEEKNNLSHDEIRKEINDAGVANHIVLALGLFNGNVLVFDGGHVRMLWASSTDSAAFDYVLLS